VNDDPIYYTRYEAASRLRVHPRLLWEMEEEGRISSSQKRRVLREVYTLEQFAEIRSVLNEDSDDR
jgi:hypothetical protein